MKAPRSPIPNSDDFRVWLRHAAKMLGVSYYAIGRRSKLGPNLVADFAEARRAAITLDTACKIAGTVRDMAREAGVDLPEPANIGEVRV